jgi:hypothetical protein
VHETVFPMSTGQVCRLLQTAEHRVINPIRQGKVDVPNIGGRRLWSAEHVLAVAKLIGKDTPALRNACRQGGGPVRLSEIMPGILTDIEHSRCPLCYRCGVPVESPQARNEKHQWLCAECWQRAEDRRREAGEARR